MLSKTYKATMKTIVRSPLVWAAAALMLGVALFFVYMGGYGGFDFSKMEQYGDRDPRFVLNEGQYAQHFHNVARREVMGFSCPLFCVIVVGVVLRRDWSDSFFEIEHAGDVRPSSYFFGRYLALTSFLTVSVLLVYLISFHLYIITRGGVPGVGPWEYFVDSNVRLLRLFFIAIVPGILVFTGVALFAGNVTKSGTVGTVVGIVYVLFEFASHWYLSYRMPQVYLNYLTPKPDNLYNYWAYYDTEWFDSKWPHNPFTTEQMLLCLGILYCAAAAFTIAVYLRVRKREI